MNALLKTLALALLLAAPLAAQPATSPNAPKSHVVAGHGDVPLVVQEWGNPDGPPILFIHGFSFGAVSFKNQIGEIAERHRLIALDLRGHGLSAKPWTPDAYNRHEIWADDIAAVLKALNVQKPVIVGWSFGGYVALDYLRQCGSGCAAGLVLTGSVAGLVPPPPPPEPAASGMPPPKGDARADNYHDFFEAADWLSRIMTAEPPPPLDKFQKQMTIAMTSPMVRRAMAGLQLDNQDLAPKLDLPVLFIHGLADGSVPPATIAAAAARLPDARDIAYEGVGHSAFAERPARFNADLMAFARSVAPVKYPVKYPAK